MNLWYVIQTKPKKEHEANSYLSFKGLEIFNPLAETFVSRNRKVVKEVHPLFPSYLFGHFDLERDYNLVKWGKGVKKILGFGGVPSPLSEIVIGEIKRRTAEDGVVKVSHNYRPNDPVRIKAGPLKDLIGIFERWVPETERVQILMNLIGYQTKVELHACWIEGVA